MAYDNIFTTDFPGDNSLCTIAIPDRSVDAVESTSDRTFHNMESMKEVNVSADTYNAYQSDVQATQSFDRVGAGPSIFDDLDLAYTPAPKRSRLDAGAEFSYTNGDTETTVCHVDDVSPQSESKPTTSSVNEDDDYYEYYYQMKDCHEELLKEIEDQLAREDSELDRKEKDLLAKAEQIVQDAQADRAKKAILKKERKSLRHRQSLMTMANREKCLYCCFICSKAFLDEELVRQHVASVHLKDSEKHPLKCPHCYMRFSRGRNLYRHVETHTHSKNGYFPCTQCPSVFKEEISLAIHKSKVHSASIDDEPLFKEFGCRCGEEFGIEEEFKRHRYYCENKDTILAKRKMAKQRITIGSTTVSPALSVASMSSMSTTSSAVSSSGKSIKDKSCPFCYLQCASMQSRERHINRKHPELANTAAAQSSYVVVDSPNLPFACLQCSKRFASHASLCTHTKRIHEKKLDHVCDICLKGYPLASELKKHINRVHNSTTRDSTKLELDEF